MDLNEIIAKAEADTVIQYVVYKENTLGYVFKNNHGTFLFGVLHGSVLKGGFDGLSGPHFLLPSELQYLRTATLADFDEYRVCLPPDFKEVNYPA